LIAVADQQQDILLSATIVITSGSYNYTQELDKIANNIVTIKDGLTNYMVVVQKQGYKSYTYTFTLDSLKTYEVKAGNLPLVVELTKNDLVTDLVAYYPFNANANDESGNGNNGIVNNGTLVPDRKGNINSAYYFDFDLGISVPGFGDVVPTDEITISLWATAPESNTNFPIFLGSIYDQSRLSISINYFHDGQNTIFWDYGYRQESGDAPGRLYYRPAPVDGNWHHYVFISSTSEHTMKMFKDNVLLCEKTESLSLVNPAGKILYIGTRFKGNLDDIRIYKRILNAEEIAALYNE
jgi:hypothetical protein